MRLGVISDVHGNRVALEAVLDDLPDVDRLVCAGDVVGYNPWPADCVAAMRDRSIPTVMGNHDRAVAGETPFRFNSIAAAGVDYARERLDDDGLAWLADLPSERAVAGGRVKLVHGHPDDPDRYTYPEEFSARMLQGEDLLVTGHTHVQGHRVFEDGVVMNPGSVGQPRDGDPKSGYAVVELSEGSGGDAVTVEERRVAYDVDEVVTAVEEAGLPARIGTRLYEGR
ncbi:metallophosphoesterase [Haloplanus salinus]|uniref:Phosphoesterase n=1 Tax=Haloplanus salinus TaxID=1126245 RepID=A0A368NCC4_9EURY|nr:metallophosphoesterase family protein [Haloplanus salinus]RCU47131.1 metallophosphoesterase [Haloplanus salinus]